MNLYHYTDQIGFLGIVENNCLWATKIQYLNDNNEFKLALNISKQLLNERLNASLNSSEKFRVKRLIENLDNIKNINICVSSLSEKGDLLSQWRGYSSKTGGYSVGFNKDNIEKQANSLGFELLKCEYKKQKHQELVSSLISETLFEFKDYLEPEKSCLGLTSDSASYFCTKLAQLAPIIKDPSFCEESEWRLVSKNGLNFNLLDFRSGKSMLTPYFKINLDGNISKYISEIIVGHTPHVELAVNSTEAFMYKHNCKCSIRSSSIPFRNW